MTDHQDEFIIDKYKQAYKEFLWTLTFEALYHRLSIGQLREAIMDNNPTGKGDSGFEDERNNL